MITGQNKYASVSLLGPRQDAIVSHLVEPSGLSAAAALPLNVCP